MPPEPEEPPSTNARLPQNGNSGRSRRTLFQRALSFFLPSSSPDSSLRETIEGYIDEQDNNSDNPALEHEKLLLSNILELGALTAEEVMIPRADIRAVDVSISKDELLSFFTDSQVSRVPVYKGTLDDVLGTIHIKDVFKSLATGEDLDIRSLLTGVPIISPALPVLDLLLEMRQSRRHMALVVDEYGGIDGLVTIGDIIEAIVGEIDDEHGTDQSPEIVEIAPDTFLADARVDIEDFEERFGDILTEEEREESDTLGGLVFHMAGRVPARGEVLTHETGMVFEVLDADPRRISRLRIRTMALAAE